MLQLKRLLQSREHVLVHVIESNRSNLLDMGGKVAETIRQLIKKLWTSAPGEFQSIVERLFHYF
ncbi:uncharacterized protein MELLADRAFT_89412 [Melampsora larici-populina 98AG31]|uniref:Uncharacterized protein n=1 Tax=Melampsora larici-populina (strain 98AG31 / pathotype 3-4-7) TaxID=747676 RepID=F4SE80_MELLP|nr:uncharacterized protein MELLADRAFT_89412 [Melampsora larici-populina 98AG31]EGF97044.1 hypothetical protein MELLADRAFT_89412 [Melampsora larici-populina 98AG31]